MMRFLSIPFLVLAACLVSSCARIFATETRKLTVPHVAGSALHVTGRNASVRVAGNPQATAVQVEATLRAVGKTQEEADSRLREIELVAERDGSGRLQVHAVFPGERRSGDGAGFAIELPSADGVKIRSSNGSLEISGLAGAADLDSSNGKVLVDGHRGNLAVKTSNGAVQVRGATGDVIVDTSNGSVDVHVNAGRLEIDTSNAKVRVRAGSGFAGKLNLKTSNAKIRVTDPANRLESRAVGDKKGVLVFSQQGPASKVETSNAAIEIEVSAPAEKARRP